MQTSNFARNEKHSKAVAICLNAPWWWKGRMYPPLAPSASILREYQLTGFGKELYTRRFNEEILAKLDAKKVFDELGDDAVLLCYESPGEFCHRRLVAEWFEKELGITVNEL